MRYDSVIIGIVPPVALLRSVILRRGWLYKRMINVLSIMNYNLLHFRLTDDQTFNVHLESQPLLAYPTTLNNNTKVYSPKELRDIVKYAKSKGIHVVPEINVPGHGMCARICLFTCSDIVIVSIASIFIFSVSLFLVCLS